MTMSYVFLVEVMMCDNPHIKGLKGNVSDIKTVIPTLGSNLY